MGAGKSFLGKLWGEMHAIPFYDLDTLIEEEERKTVTNIFEVFGEDYFREREAAVLRNTDRFENCIIACGGVPAMPKLFNIGDPRVMDSTGALLLPPTVTPRGPITWTRPPGWS